jgi:hypothetical protein
METKLAYLDRKTDELFQRTLKALQAGLEPPPSSEWAELVDLEKELQAEPLKTCHATV